MNHDLDRVLRAAQAEGLLPAEATAPAVETRPWPVVLLTALGAWLAAVPLFAVIGMLLGDLAVRGVGTHVVGALLLLAAVIVLRRPEVPVFLEQLSMPALLAGAGTLAFGLTRDLPHQAAAALLAVLSLALAHLIDRPWLRTLLGAAAATCAALALWPGHMHQTGTALWWGVLHVVLALWLLALAVLHRRLIGGTHARSAALLECVGNGWLLATLAGLAVVSGMAFLAPGVLGGGLLGAVAMGVAGHLPVNGLAWLQHLLSAALALAGAGLLARAWPTLARHTPLGAGLAALCLVALAFLIPTLGAALLALALMLITRRARLAGAAGLAAAWMLGSFYYALWWPLAHKAVVLVAVGAALGVLSWKALRSAAPGQVPTAATPHPLRSTPARVATAAVALSVVATLVAAQVAIRDKERLIAQGRPLYVRLAPVDPRSLMQGDFMRLNFNLPDAAARADTGLLNALNGQRPFVVARVDARGVATLHRLHTSGQALAPNEQAIELTPKNGQWTLVTDAWFFREGEAERWQRAAFGEFRVGADGRALLVGLADEGLKPIRP